MASTKISVLPELVTPSSNGSNTVFVVVDKASGTFTTKQISLSNLDLYIDNVAPLALAQANSAYTKANSANITADSAYAFANIANIKVDSAYAFANTANIKLDSAYAWANTINIKTDAAFTKANAANVLAQSAYDKANLDTTNIATSAGFYGDTISVATFNLAANGRIISASNVAITGFANTTYTQAAFDKANTANITAQAAFNQANTKILTQNPQSSDYTLALSDAGKHIYYTTASNTTVYLPTTANVAFSNGTTVMIISKTASSANVTISPNTDVSLYFAGNTTSAARNVTTYGVATLNHVEANTWFVYGIGVTSYV
jgi:hypothetical protein